MPAERATHGRRPVLRAIGATSALPLFGSGVVAASEGRGDDSNGDGSNGDGSDDGARPPVIHPQFGYSGTAEEAVPENLTPDATVGLHTDEEKIDDSNLPAVTVEFGAFHFDPVGLQVEPGSIVEFDFATPEHTATAYHPAQGRQQRVPDGIPPFSSTVNAAGGFWLYRFEEEGVYDLLCAPHEFGGMGMRIVVGDSPGPVVRAAGRPPLPLTAALLGQGTPADDPDLGPPEMAPANIVENGPVSMGDLDVDLEVTITAPSPTSENDDGA